MEGAISTTTMYTPELYDQIMNSIVVVQGVNHGEPSKLLKVKELTANHRNQLYPGLPEYRPEDELEMEEDLAATTSTNSEHPNVSDGFITVCRPSRKRPQETQANSSTKISKINSSTNIPSSNKYAPLREVLLNDKNVQAPAKTHNNAKKVPTPKVRFITIKTNESTKQILNKLAKAEHCSFAATPSGEFTRIYPKTPENYQAIVAKLDELKVQHYLLRDKNSAPLKVVVRGLPINMSEIEITEGLGESGYAIEKVSQMTKFTTKKPMPLFLVTLPDNDKNREIFKIEQLLHYIVKIENYNRPTRTIQCFKCQYFHHSSENCKMAPRCVKCAGPHQTQDCTEGQGKIPMAKCCNCGANHPASYRGCPKFPENIKKAFVAKKTSANTSYASLFKNQTPQPTSAPSPPQQTNNSINPLIELNNILHEIALEFNVNSFSDLVNKFRDVLNSIRSTSDHSTKITTLMEALNIKPTLAP